MRKFLLMVFIGSSVLAKAQTPKTKFSIGPNAGVGASWISNVDNSKSKLAGNAGLALVYSAAEHFGIGVDVKYSFEGGKAELGTNKITQDLDYVRIPVKLTYFFNNYGDRVRPKLSVGPSFGFLTKAHGTVENGSTVVSEVDNKGEFNTFDFGLLGSAGLNYRLVKYTWLTVDVNYLHGLSNINQKPAANEPANRNRNIMVNVGVNFGI